MNSFIKIHIRKKIKQIKNNRKKIVKFHEINDCVVRCLGLIGVLSPFIVLIKTEHRADLHLIWPHIYRHTHFTPTITD